MHLERLDQQREGHLLAAELLQHLLHHVLFPQQPSLHTPCQRVRARCADSQPLYFLLEAREHDHASGQGGVAGCVQLRAASELRLDIVAAQKQALDLREGRADAGRLGADGADGLGGILVLVAQLAEGFGCLLAVGGDVDLRAPSAKKSVVVRPATLA